MSNLVNKTEKKIGKDSAVDAVELDEVSTGKATGKSLLDGNLEVIKNVKVTLEVVLGHAELEVKKLFDLKSQSVVKLDKSVSEPIDIRLDNNVVARGELVAVDDSFGIRIVEISSWK